MTAPATDPFSDPAESSFFTIKDHVGSLVLVGTNEFLPQYPTKAGFKDTVRAELAVIDGPGSPNRYANALLFNGKIVGVLRNEIGNVKLGRIVLGEAQPGKNQPYELAKPTDQDKEIARRWWATNPPIIPQPVQQAQFSGVQVTQAPQQTEQWRVQGQQQQGNTGYGHQTVSQNQYTQPPQPAGVGAGSYISNEQPPF